MKVAPNLCCVRFTGSRPRLGAPGLLSDAANYPFRKVAIANSEWGDEATENTDKLLMCMPFLRYLEINICVAKVLTVIANNGRGECSRELVNLLVACRKLKEYTGSGHIILAEDILANDAWTCWRLEKLDVEIVERPRLIGDEVLLLGREIRMMNGLPDNDGDEEDGWVLTDRLLSQTTHRKVFERLTRFSKLREINFGRQSSLPKANLSRGLEFAKESGFGRIASLPWLEKMEWRGLSEDLEDGKVKYAWLKELWRMETTWEDGIYSVVAERIH
ncbi:hypothetical protein BGX23_002391 [Mortierella sp. AD031]|nr:hypothetical protein BGX23_002391 [Mortierella sp. AD031]